MRVSAMALRLLGLTKGKYLAERNQLKKMVYSGYLVGKRSLQTRKIEVEISYMRRFNQVFARLSAVEFVSR